MTKDDEKIFKLPIRRPLLPPNKRHSSEKDYSRVRDKAVPIKD